MASGRGAALITGASSGIGAAFAERLAADGNDLILVARRRGRLEDLSQRLAWETRVSVEVLPADLTSAEDLLRVEERLTGSDVSLLVNNAGFGGYRPFVDVDPGVVEDLVRVHVLATARLTRAALPGMVARGRGGIINVASLLAFSGTLPPTPLPHRATYAGAKSFMVTFTQALAGELAGSPIKVVVCCPGVVATEFHDVVGMDMSAFPRMSAADVVQAALVALDLGEVVCVPGAEDASLIDRVTAAQQAVMGSGGPKLASRYDTA